MFVSSSPCPRVLATTSSRLQFLRELGFQEENDGCYAGGGHWRGSGSVSTTLSPTTGQALLKIRQANEGDYDACIAAMEAARKPWAEVSISAAH